MVMCVAALCIRHQIWSSLEEEHSNIHDKRSWRGYDKDIIDKFKSISYWGEISHPCPPEEANAHAKLARFFLLKGDDGYVKAFYWNISWKTLRQGNSQCSKPLQGSGRHTQAQMISTHTHTHTHTGYHFIIVQSLGIVCSRRVKPISLCFFNPL